MARHGLEKLYADLGWLELELALLQPQKAKRDQSCILVSNLDPSSCVHRISKKIGVELNGSSKVMVALIDCCRRKTVMCGTKCTRFSFSPELLYCHNP